MIYSLRGRIICKEDNLAVIECGGVGYACRTTLNTLSRLECGENETVLYTFMNVHEGGIELFGFADKSELNCFKMLLSVSGVGAKAGLSILSDFTPEQFATIIASGDSRTLTKSKGIGAKTAQRIVLELKDKVTAESSGYELSGASEAVIKRNSARSEALEGLMVLGYTQSEVMPVLSGLDEKLDTAGLIREVLRAMSKK
ncbi:MAG: Holliday junction branch migration protein RuvA [Oscillospiraceae bacterium]|nr:Holliday junction branch migration protein RuvA [Oscillospiraceae bacterium]